MKILINRVPQNGPWGGGNQFLKAFFEYTPNYNIQLGTRINQSYDAIFIIDVRADELGVGFPEIQRYKLLKPNTKILGRINECDARKGEQNVIDPMLLSCSEYNDFTFFVSDWMRDYHVSRGWKCANTEVIYNGVDKTIFRPNQKLNNGKTNIVTAHWSSNKFKGYDVHEWLDKFVGQNSEKFTYTFIGRHQNNFRFTRHIEPLWGNELGAELGKYDICINGSRCDPGPNSVIESISCGLPTYVHEHGGGAVEFAGNDHVYHDVDDLVSFLNSPTKNSWAPDDWQTCIEAYVKRIKEVVGHD